MIEKSKSFWPKLDRKRLKLMVIVAGCVTLVSGWLVGFSQMRSCEPSSLTKERAEKERQWLMGEGAFFVRKGCVRCHSIGSMGIDAAKIGPDLSDAVVDVERRFGKSLEEFLNNPTGTMSVVLMTRIPLTDEEKREAIETLKIAYQRKLERQAQAQK
jgi:cytochrome c2